MKSLSEFFKERRKKRAYLNAKMSGAKIVDYEMYEHKKNMEELSASIVLILFYLSFFFFGMIVGASIIVNNIG